MRVGCVYLEDCQGEPSQLTKDNCYVARAASGCWTSGLLDRPGGHGDLSCPHYLWLGGYLLRYPEPESGGCRRGCLLRQCRRDHSYKAEQLSIQGQK